MDMINRSAIVVKPAQPSREIFEEQLNGWYYVPSVWPEERELNAFLRWFDCSFHSLVVVVNDERAAHRHLTVLESNPIIWTLRRQIRTPTCQSDR